MPKVIHFDISADEPENAVRFYETVFGWKFDKWEGPMEYWMIKAGPEDEPGINGGLSKRTPDGVDVNTIGVPSLDEYVKKIEEAGGIIIVPKSPIPGIGWFAVFKDPEGNVFGMMEEDEDAK